MPHFSWGKCGFSCNNLCCRAYTTYRGQRGAARLQWRVSVMGTRVQVAFAWVAVGVVFGAVGLTGVKVLVFGLPAGVAAGAAIGAVVGLAYLFTR